MTAIPFRSDVCVACGSEPALRGETVCDGCNQRAIRKLRAISNDELNSRALGRIEEIYRREHMRVDHSRLRAESVEFSLELLSRVSREFWDHCGGNSEHHCSCLFCSVVHGY
jgi:hypothetical protein